jgi:hypothetical protein
VGLAIFYDQRAPYQSNVQRLIDTWAGEDVLVLNNIWPHLTEKEFLTFEPGGFGFGYYAWKPVVIEVALGIFDSVLYHDAGRDNQYVYDLSGVCTEYWPEIVIGEGFFTHTEWCKDSCIKDMGCSGLVDGVKQAVATWCFFRRSAAWFVSEWRRWCFTDCVKGPSPHRWDQAILTNLCLLHGVSLFKIRGSDCKDIKNALVNVSHVSDGAA